MRRFLLLAALTVLAAGPALAQGAIPTSPITVIVPFAAGGPTDVVARLVGEHMSRTLGQQLVVENVGGAGGTTGMTRVAQATPDGYTIGVGNMGTQSAAPALYPNLKYDPATSFAQIGIVNFTPQAIVAKKDTRRQGPQGVPRLPQGQQHQAELRPRRRRLDLATCRARCSIRSSASSPALVAYRGTAPALNDLVGGQIDYMVDQSLNVIPQIKGGTIKAYAVAAPARLESLPDVPTTKEAGVDFIFSAWNAMVAPKGTPKEIVDKLADALSKALDDPNDQGALRRARQHGPARRRPRPGRPAEAGRERDGAHHAGAQGSGRDRELTGRRSAAALAAGRMRLTDEEQAMLAGEQGPPASGPSAIRSRSASSSTRPTSCRSARPTSWPTPRAWARRASRWLEGLAALPASRAPRARAHHHRSARPRLRHLQAPEADRRHGRHRGARDRAPSRRSAC